MMDRPATLGPHLRNSVGGRRAQRSLAVQAAPTCAIVWGKESPEILPQRLPISPCLLNSGLPPPPRTEIDPPHLPSAPPTFSLLSSFLETSTVVWMMAKGAATEATAWKALRSTTSCMGVGGGGGGGGHWPSTSEATAWKALHTTSCVVGGREASFCVEIGD